MSIRKTLVALACTLPMSAAFACGPDFPQSLLDDRKASLLGLPEGTFLFEAGRLLPKPTDSLHLVEDTTSDDPDKTRETAEAIGLSADELKKVRAMRAASAADAEAAGAGLAPELLEYTLGAVAFKRGDKAAAIAHFQRVLALAPPERPRRVLWASYMLGRARAAGGDTDGAVAAFDIVRERALSGANDPMGLAIASYGEQARIAWHHGAIVPAVKLYAEQAAHGSTGGAASLLFVARSILAHQEMLDRALDDPLSQRLLAAYLFTRSSEFAQDWPLAGTRTDADAGGGDASGTGNAGPKKAPGSVDVDGFLAAVERHGLERLDGADRLAAGAYNAGRYPLATRFAAKSDSALAAWVRAKLALRAGDMQAAQREYAKAAQGFPANESWGGDPVQETVDSPRCRVESERGLLELGRDDYIEAMARLYAGAANYWPDAAYVAERVLTVDELKAFVDRNMPPSNPPGKDESNAAPATRLRDLLARRLMREGRLQDALAYFHDPAIRQKAQALILAHKDDHAWMAVARAAALFKQAQITRVDGMELFGTELAPDNAQWGGSYPPMDLPPTKDKSFVGTSEVARVLASAAKPDGRFHYRYIAANLAERAASLVPARSQAYAAMMCQSTSWMLDTDSASASRIYHRYQHHGAYVKWAKDFGTKCPSPDFDRAKWLPLKQGWWQTRHWTRRNWPFLLIALGVAIGLFAWRKHRKTA